MQHERTTAGDQARCDVIQAEFRKELAGKKSIRRDPPPLPKALVPTDDALRTFDDAIASLQLLREWVARRTF